VTDLFRADQVIAIDPPWITGSRREIPQLLGLTGNVALVIHQSERLSIDQWVEVLTPLQQESIETYVVKPDRYQLDLDAFCGALALVAPTSTVIILESDLPAEVVATSWDFVFVAGVTSTTLTNLALDPKFTTPLISLVYSYFRIVEPDKDRLPPATMTWGFVPLGLAGKVDRISYR
jgi:hypothetical protein